MLSALGPSKARCYVHSISKHSYNIVITCRNIMSTTRNLRKRVNRKWVFDEQGREEHAEDRQYNRSLGSTVEWE
jgi:hypothetical protein